MAGRCSAAKSHRSRPEARKTALPVVPSCTRSGDWIAPSPLAPARASFTAGRRRKDTRNDRYAPV